MSAEMLVTLPWAALAAWYTFELITGGRHAR